MDALKFFKEWDRMRSSSNECAKCPFNGPKCDLIRGIMEEHIVTVEKWSQEHPRKTRQDVFLSLFPTGRLDKSGVLTICPAGVDVKLRGPDWTGCGINCDTCRREFWMQEVE